MKKILAAMTLAAAGLTASNAALAAPEDWAGDPTVVFNEVPIKSCTKPQNGVSHTMTLKVEVIADKKSWDNAMKDKTPGEQKKLVQKMLDAAVKTLNEDLRPRIADFTQDEIEEAYDLSSSEFGTDPYRASLRNAFENTVEAVHNATEIETMIGADAYPTYEKGCTLKP